MPAANRVFAVSMLLLLPKDDGRGEAACTPTSAEARVRASPNGTYWKKRAQKAEDLLIRIARANVIFPSMCANNMDALNLVEELKHYRQFAAGDEK